MKWRCPVTQFPMWSGRRTGCSSSQTCCNPPPICSTFTWEKPMSATPERKSKYFDLSIAGICFSNHVPWKTNTNNDQLKKIEKQSVQNCCCINFEHFHLFPHCIAFIVLYVVLHTERSIRRRSKNVLDFVERFLALCSLQVKRHICFGSSSVFSCQICLEIVWDD